MNRREALIGLAAATAAAVSTTVHAQQKVPISFRLDWTIYGTHAPFFLALQEGLYDRAGLDVRIGEGQGSATVAKFVAQGGDQLGFVDFGSTARAVEQGLPLKAVMRVISDAACIISHADSPIKQPKDLANKVVAFAPSESTAQVFPALLASQNVDPASVSVLNPAFGAKNAMFLQKRADAIPGFYNVQVAQLEQAGAKVEYFLLSDYGLSQMNNGVVANAAFLEKNPDAVKAFLKATQEAFLKAKDNPDLAIDALIKTLPEQRRNRDVFKRQLELSAKALTTKNTQGKPFGWMDPRDWEETQAVLVKFGGMKRSLPVEQYYSNDFLPS
ncbi:ABC transporter substrate-binding protein [Bosea lathyri]|uniref:NitT/TauT family transport system substrate-binding protein n=1 Tax=Bosea lathyri TaxID=1036778 RepID=A0A1H6C9A4_9HYPH|nr:ABC transporter substrate-binding protein [Bosea lathyri]SEG69488.1 NitT/TauT family transport system substrate-binding protein [Bosea lathyri]